MSHLVFTGVHHDIYHMGNPEERYLTSIAKVQGSSLMICTDSVKKALFTLDIYREYETIRQELVGYYINDTAVSSTMLIDEVDGNAVCGDICVDWCGGRIYALILSNDGRGAWVKVYTMLNRLLYFTGSRYPLPYDLEPRTSFSRADLYPDAGHIGLPVPYNVLCYGCGLEIVGGKLYILHRRRSPIVVGGASSYIQWSAMAVMNPHNGIVENTYVMSKPAIEGDTDLDAVYHGIAYLDGKLLTQVRYDHNALRPNPGLWLINPDNAFNSTRGQTALVFIDNPDPIFAGLPDFSFLDTTPYHNIYPWGVSMAYSISVDQGDRKVYGVFGNQVWDFDILDYTFIVRYPEYDDDGEPTGGYNFFEGDIIDLGNIIKDDRRTEIQCFLRNDSPYDMLDVEIALEPDGVDTRLDEIFIALVPTTFGYKQLSLGDILPGGSKEFWVVTHPLLSGTDYDLDTTHRMPIRVKYRTDNDEF